MHTVFTIIHIILFHTDRGGSFTDLAVSWLVSFSLAGSNVLSGLKKIGHDIINSVGVFTMEQARNFFYCILLF